MPETLTNAQNRIRLVDLHDCYNIAVRLTVGECSVLLKYLGYSQLVFDGYRCPSMSVMRVLTDDRIRDIPAKRYKVSFYGGPYTGVYSTSSAFKASFAAMTADKMLRAIRSLGRDYLEATIDEALKEFRPKGP